MKTEDRVHELFLNYACNAKCPFCYNPPLTPELLQRDLSFEQAAQSLYMGARSRARRLNLHGGEVTLRDDLPKMLRLARKLGFDQITVVTNGLRLSRLDYAKSLTEAGATHFRLSVHGPDARTHDPILAIPGAFDKALRAVYHLQAIGVPLGLNFVLFRSNYRALPAFLDKFCLDLGIADVIVYFPHLRGMMALNAEEAGVAYAEVVPFVREGAARLERAGRLSALLLANFVPCVLPELSELMIDWSHHPGDGASMTHPEGFTDDIHEMKDGQRHQVGACGGCALRRRCLGVEREYLRRYGEGDFSALRPDRAPQAL